jgi:hypothetical protein
MGIVVQRCMRRHVVYQSISMATSAPSNPRVRLWDGPMNTARFCEIPLPLSNLTAKIHNVLLFSVTSF